MSDTVVFKATRENAKALVDAAAGLGVDRHAVRFVDGMLQAPLNVAQEAGLVKKPAAKKSSKHSQQSDKE